MFEDTTSWRDSWTPWSPWRCDSPAIEGSPQPPTSRPGQPHFVVGRGTGSQARRNLRDLPHDIKRLEERLAGLTADMAIIAANDGIPSRKRSPTA